MAKPKNQGDYTEEETARRRDEALKRTLSAPPRQHKEDVGKKRSSQTGAPSKGKAKQKQRETR